LEKTFASRGGDARAEQVAETKAFGKARRQIGTLPKATPQRGGGRWQAIWRRVVRNQVMSSWQMKVLLLKNRLACHLADANGEEL